MVSVLKNLSSKVWAALAFVLGAVLFLWSKEKLDTANAQVDLADTKKTDAVLASQQANVQQQIAATEAATKAEEAKPAPTGDQLAKDTNAI